MNPAASPITEISADKLAKLSEAAKPWIALDSAKGPVDREMAEYALSLLYGKDRPYIAWLKSPLASHLAAAFLALSSEDRDEALLTAELWKQVREKVGDEVLKDVRQALESTPWSGRGVVDMFDIVTTGSTKQIGETQWTIGYRIAHRIFSREAEARELWWGCDDISLPVMLRVADALGAKNTAEIEETDAGLQSRGGGIHPAPRMTGWFPNITSVGESCVTFIHSFYADPYEDLVDRRFHPRESGAQPTAEHGKDNFCRLFLDLLDFESWYRRLPLIALWHTCAEVFGDQLPTEYSDTLNYLEPHRMLAENIGYILPYSNICFLSDRSV